MEKASYIGTISLDLLKLPSGVASWEPYETDDIFATNLITFPHDYLLTIGSAAHPSYTGIFTSLATTPAYQLPTQTQMYVAGRDVIRWGGSTDPHEVDFDRYVFAPIPGKTFASVFKAPKSEPHHLSDVPNLMSSVPKSWQEVFEAIRTGKLP